MIDLKTTLKNAVMRAGENKLNVSLAIEITGTHSWDMYYNIKTKCFSYSYRDSKGKSCGMFSDATHCQTFEDVYSELTWEIERLTSED